MEAGCRDATPSQAILQPPPAGRGREGPPPELLWEWAPADRRQHPRLQHWLHPPLPSPPAAPSRGPECAPAWRLDRSAAGSLASVLSRSLLLS